MHPRTALSGAIGAAFIFALVTSVSNAQYLPPIGSVTLTASATNAEPGQIVDIQCVLRDRAGAALPFRQVTFVVSSSPGDARLDRSNATTDAGGSASARLDVGTRPGAVQVLCSGEGLSSLLTLQVLAARPTGQPSLAPVAAEAPVIAPRTGDAGPGREGALAYAGALLAAVAAGALLAVALPRRGRPSR